MKVGDLIRYNPLKLPPPVSIAVVLFINNEGGTVRTIDQSGEVRWMVQSGCEVISESR